MSPDPTEAIRARAATMPAVAAGTSCNQSAFKVGQTSFLFIGPGARGEGFKAMFKLGPSTDQALVLAAERPDRFQVGKTGWVTVRFSEDEPLPPAIWQPWLQESYDLSCAPRRARAKKSPAKR